MRSTETFYAVQLPPRNGRKPRLALSNVACAGPQLFYWRASAALFKRQLVSEGFKRAKVVKVRVTYRW